MKKNILHVIEAAGGGALQYVVDICNHLSADEWEIEVVYSRRNVTPEDVVGLFAEHVTVTEVTMARELSIRTDLMTYKYLRAKFREKQWDLIHLHSSKAGALGRFAARGLKIPVIYTPHGYSFYQQDIGQIKQKAYYCLEKMLDKVHKSEMLVSSVNEYRDAKKLIHQESRIDRISNSVPIPSKSQKKSVEEEFLLITVGRLTAAKNPDLILEVIEEAHKKYKDLKFVWIGDGEYRREIEEKVAIKKLPIRITGWLERTEIATWYLKSSVYIQLSLWEGLPLAVLEAMASECAIIASDIPAHRELIESGSNGILASDKQTIVNEIAALIEHPEVRMKFGKASKQIVEEGYSINQFSTKIQHYYKRILKEG